MYPFSLQFRIIYPPFIRRVRFSGINSLVSRTHCTPYWVSPVTGIEGEAEFELDHNPDTEPFEALCVSFFFPLGVMLRFDPFLPGRRLLDPLRSSFFVTWRLSRSRHPFIFPFREHPVSSLFLLCVGGGPALALSFWTRMLKSRLQPITDCLFFVWKSLVDPFLTRGPGRRSAKPDKNSVCHTFSFCLGGFFFFIVGVWVHLYVSPPVV